ncbi:Sec-independent protein translocase protein TatB [Aurantiacibacter spongiae]|uniref:Twin-arginine translocase subunit TatB n=1 Tax=Aurantiacibacter spongiae TaxID=2488860 RepID=A0A3N5CSB5_9SPHN|nr:Sec-independent protein translocase protein TatB [Aurantiacibacter spongiae]RPF72024.1 twin-arginine translocase subunit TatB [Aurantiacibacter spongiae]
MFDVGATELLVIVIVAVVVIGPKDMPLAMRTAGRWIGKIRRLTGHFRAGIDAMVREAELEDMEKKWKAQNEKVMRDHPDGGPAHMEPTGAYPPAKQVEMKRLTDEQSTLSGSGAESAARPVDAPPRSTTGNIPGVTEGEVDRAQGSAPDARREG